MASNYREVRAALLDAIKEGVDEVTGNEFTISSQAATLETLARSFSLLQGKSE